MQSRQVEKVPKFVDVLGNKLGMSDSALNYVCTLSNPEGKPDVDAVQVR
jgi:hypothetical protein